MILSETTHRMVSKHYMVLCQIIFICMVYEEKLNLIVLVT